jgi:hypothetical protein
MESGAERGCSVGDLPFVVLVASALSRLSRMAGGRIDHCSGRSSFSETAMALAVLPDASSSISATLCQAR